MSSFTPPIERSDMQNKKVKASGFTLVEIMIVVAIIGILASIAIPNYVHSREVAHRTVCITNLRQIEGAIQSWAMETGKQTTQPVSYEDIAGYLQRKVACPAGGTCFVDSYEIKTVQDVPACIRVASGQYAHKL